jgi:hypothetical protein
MVFWHTLFNHFHRPTLPLSTYITFIHLHYLYSLTLPFTLVIYYLQCVSLSFQSSMLWLELLLVLEVTAITTTAFGVTMIATQLKYFYAKPF